MAVQPRPRVRNKSFTQQAQEYISTQIKWRAWGAAIGLIAGLVAYGSGLVDSSPPADDHDGSQNARVAAEAAPPPNRRQAQIDAALGQLNGDSPAQQCDATIVLGRLKSEEAVGPIRELLRRNDVDVFVQTCAARALMALGDDDVARGYFREWIQSDNIQLFDAANKAYAQLGPEAAVEAIPLLTIVARSNSPSRRRDILRTLTAIGPEAEPLLTELAADKDPWVKQRATEALAKLK
jgi:HEAT repeat protein